MANDIAVTRAPVPEATAVEFHDGGAIPLAMIESVLGAWPVSLLALSWVASGVGAALVLRRRGHDLRSLLGLAVVLGPLFLPLALDLVRRREPATPPIPIAPGSDRPGHRAVVVLLGAPETAADALPMLRRIEPLGPVMLVALIDFESAQREGWDDEKSTAMQRLRSAAVLLEEFEPGQVLVPGTLQTGIATLGLGSGDLVLIVGDAVTPGAEQLSGLTRVPVISMPATSAPD